MYAPSRWEAWALGAGGPVEVTGTGPRRAHRAAASLPAGPVLVAGIAGALAPDLATGDVVVADEVRGPDEVRRLASAPSLAAALRRAGVPVRLGPVLSADRVIAGSRRAVLAGSGALAVEMESSWLLAGRTAPDVVVRVIADVAGSALLRPATLLRLRTAWRTLRRLAPLLHDWADHADDVPEPHASSPPPGRGSPDPGWTGLSFLSNPLHKNLQRTFA